MGRLMEFPSQGSRCIPPACPHTLECQEMLQLLECPLECPPQCPLEYQEMLQLLECPLECHRPPLSVEWLLRTKLLLALTHPLLLWCPPLLLCGRFQLSLRLLWRRQYQTSVRR